MIETYDNNLNIYLKHIQLKKVQDTEILNLEPKTMKNDFVVQQQQC